MFWNPHSSHQVILNKKECTFPNLRTEEGGFLEESKLADFLVLVFGGGLSDGEEDLIDLGLDGRVYVFIIGD